MGAGCVQIEENQRQKKQRQLELILRNQKSLNIYKNQADESKNINDIEANKLEVYVKKQTELQQRIIKLEDENKNLKQEHEKIESDYKNRHTKQQELQGEIKRLQQQKQELINQNEKEKLQKESQITLQSTKIMVKISKYEKEIKCRDQEIEQKNIYITLLEEKWNQFMSFRDQFAEQINRLAQEKEKLRQENEILKRTIRMGRNNYLQVEQT